MMPQTRSKSEYLVPKLLAILLFSAFFVLFDWTYASITILLLFLLMAVSMMMLRSGSLFFMSGCLLSASFASSA